MQIRIALFQVVTDPDKSGIKRLLRVGHGSILLFQVRDPGSGSTDG